MSVPYIKIGALVGTLFVTLISSAIPRLILRFTKTEDSRPRALFYYLMLFSASFIACTGLNHALPNAVDAFNAYQHGLGYPWPGIIATASWTVAYIMDTIMDHRKQTVSVTYNTMLVDTDDDLPPANPWLFTAAIYIASSLEGLVLGASPLDTGEQTKYLYIILTVLTLHKAVEGFSLANVYEAYEYDLWMQVGLLAVYAVLTPIGILSGLILLLSFSGHNALIAGIFSSIAAGIFIYAGISLFVSRVIPNTVRTNWRFLCMGLGWLASSAISWFA